MGEAREREAGLREDVGRWWGWGGLQGNIMEGLINSIVGCTLRLLFCVQLFKVANASSAP